VSGTISFCTSFFSLGVTLHVCQTRRAADLLERKAGDFFYPPHSREDVDRIGPLVRHRVKVFGSSDRAWDDIVIGGMGWLALSGYGSKELDVWVPQGVKVFRRPSLLPQEMRNRGVTRFHANHRARTPRIRRKKKAIVRARKDKELRDSLRAEQALAEAERAAPIGTSEGASFVDDDLDLGPGYTLVGLDGEPRELASGGALPADLEVDAAPRGDFQT
ncbi:unnamed protein product, partial [Prorocentrum cordatum]